MRLSRFSNCLRHSEFITDQGLLADVGILCEGPAVDDILTGNYHTPDHLHPCTKLVLEFLPTPEEIKNNPMGTPQISPTDHAKGWKKAREHTASEPTTLDFSQYICAAYDDALAAMDAKLREVPLQYGFAPDEWNPMTDCSIPKKATSPRAEEMRTIVLMDAAYNFNNKWYGREFKKTQKSTLRLQTTIPSHHRPKGRVDATATTSFQGEGSGGSYYICGNKCRKGMQWAPS